MRIICRITIAPAIILGRNGQLELLIIHVIASGFHNKCYQERNKLLQQWKEHRSNNIGNTRQTTKVDVYLTIWEYGETL